MIRSKKPTTLPFLIFLFLPLFIATECFLLFSLWRAGRVRLAAVAKESSRFSPLLASDPYFLSSKPKKLVLVDDYIVAADSRPAIIKKYLTYYHSPLAPLADYIFAVSQQYGLDYRLLVAIAQQESNLCKKSPPRSFNCWGWGINDQGTLRFPSYEKAIRAVAKGIRENYLDEGLDTPEKIMKKYTPSSRGSWAFGVGQFMDEMSSGDWR